MNNISLNSKSFIEKELQIRNRDLNSNQVYFTNLNSNNELFYLVNEINDILKNHTQIEDLIDQVINKLQSNIKFQGYSLIVHQDNKVLFEKSLHFKNELVDYLNHTGVIKLAIQERRSLTIINPENNIKNSKKRIIVIPVLGSENEHVIFLLEIREEDIDLFNRSFSILEMIFNLIGQVLLRTVIKKQNDELKEIINREMGVINKDFNYSTVGQICLKSFHSLKNRTQVLLSAFNLLEKLIDKKDHRVDKVFEILDREIPEFSKTIKSLSELSKIITTNRKPNYIEFQKLIIDILDYLQLIDVMKDFKIKLEKPSKSRVFGNYEVFVHAFLLMFLELNSLGINEVELTTNEDEFRLNINLKSNLKSFKNDLNDLLEVNTNIKFVRIKSLFNVNACSFVMNYSTNVYEIMISIPKRSSQFAKVINYAKDSNS